MEKGTLYIDMETNVELRPTWEFAVKIYIEVLENDKASYEGKQIAREELIKLAQIVDNQRKEG